MRYLKIPVSILFKPFEAFKPGQFMGFEGRVLFGVLWIDEQTETKCKKLFNRVVHMLKDIFGISDTGRRSTDYFMKCILSFH